MNNSQEIFSKVNNPYMAEWSYEIAFDILDFQIRKIIHTEHEKGDEWYPGQSYVSEIYYAVFLKKSKVYIDHLYGDIEEAKWDLQRLQRHYGITIPLTCKIDEKE